MSLYVFGRSLGLLPVLAVLVVGFPALIFQEMKETKPEKTGHVNFFRRHVDPMDPDLGRSKCGQVAWTSWCSRNSAHFLSVSKPPKLRKSTQQGMSGCAKAGMRCFRALALRSIMGACEEKTQM